MNVNRSFSQLSISKEQPKKKKMATITATNQSDNQIVQERNGSDQDEGNEPLPMSYMQSLKPSYLNVPDKIFKEMLSKTIENGDHIIPSLNTTEKLQLVRQITEAT